MGVSRNLQSVSWSFTAWFSLSVWYSCVFFLYTLLIWSTPFIKKWACIRHDMPHAYWYGFCFALVKIIYFLYVFLIYSILSSLENVCTHIYWCKFCAWWGYIRFVYFADVLETFHLLGACRQISINESFVGNCGKPLLLRL